MTITSSISKHLFRITSIFFLVLIFTLLFIQSAFAQAYGEGSYGGSEGNSVYGGVGSQSNDNNEDDGDDEDDDNKCDDTRPGDNPPQITKVIVDKSAKTIALTFTSGAGPREGFEIRYTTNPEDFSSVDHYDIENDRNSYDRTINISNTSADHYIKLRAVNGCAEGPYSKTQLVKSDGDPTIGTTTYTYDAQIQVEQGSGIGGIGGIPVQTDEELQEQDSQESATGSSGFGDGTDQGSIENIPGLGDDNVAEGHADNGFNWNPLENILLLGIIGAIFFTTSGIMIVRRFIL